MDKSDTQEDYEVQFDLYDMWVYRICLKLFYNK